MKKVVPVYKQIIKATKADQQSDAYGVYKDAQKVIEEYEQAIGRTKTYEFPCASGDQIQELNNHVWTT